MTSAKNIKLIKILMRDPSIFPIALKTYVSPNNFKQAINGSVPNANSIN